MIHNKKNELAKVRAKANIRVQDLAMLLNMSPVTLVQMESGKQTPSLSVIAIYHLLFDASFDSVFANLYADMHTYLNERGEMLIAELESSQSTKSQRIIQAFSKIVKLLNKDHYDELD
ncbi:MAG: helix-turn-helix transcriptional regulator [Flavobacteriaceae bacterium]